MYSPNAPPLSPTIYDAAISKSDVHEAFVVGLQSGVDSSLVQQLYIVSYMQNYHLSHTQHIIHKFQST